MSQKAVREQVAASLAAAAAATAAAATNTSVDATANGGVVPWRVQGWRSNDKNPKGTASWAAEVAEGAGDGGGRGDRWGESQLRRVPAAPSRPTHFLALRLSHAPSVTEAIERVHQSLRDHHPSLEDHLEPPVKAHLTLMVMALHSGPLSQLPSPVGIVPTLQLMQPPTEELPSWRLVRCLQLVTELPGVLQDAALNAPLPLTLRGLGSFGGRVLFLEVAKKEIEYRQEGADPASPGAEDPVAAAVVASTGKPAKATEALACGRNSSSTITERGRPGEGGAAATENAAACVAVTNADGAASESVLQRLLRLQSVVAAHFEELKYNDGGQSFAPHVTVAKVTYKPPGASQWQGKGGSNRDVGDKRIYTNDNGNDNGNGNGNRPQYGTWKSGDGNCGASASEGHRKSIPDQHAGPQRHGALEPTASAAATAAATAAAKATKVYGCANPGGCGEITVSDAAATAAAAATTATNAVAVKSITDEYGNRIIDFLAPASAAAPTLTPSLQRKRQEQQKQQQEQREMEKHNQEHKEYGKPLKNIPRQAYEALLDIDAGCVIVDRIQLCVMGGRTPGNYYQVLAEVKLDGKCVGELHGGEGGSDSSDCCPDDKLAPNPTEAASSGLVPHPQLHTAVRMTGAALALLSTPPR